jgi:hypothetical protein
MVTNVLCENFVMDLGNDAQNSEGAHPGAPPAFMNKPAVAQSIGNGSQLESGQELALAMAETEAGQQFPAPPLPAAVKELIPEIQRPVPMCRRGRPTVMTPAIKEQLCLLLSLGLSRRQAAAYLDISHTTIANLAARDPDFARGLERAEDLKVAEALVFVAAESRRNWRAAAWLIDRAPKIRAPKTPEERAAAQALRLEKIKHKSECKVLEEALSEDREEARKQRAILRKQAEYARDRAREKELRQDELAQREARRAKRLAEERGEG